MSEGEAAKATEKVEEAKKEEEVKEEPKKEENEEKEAEMKSIRDEMSKPVDFDPEMLQRACEEFAALAASVPRCEQYRDAVCEICDRTAARLDEFTVFLDGLHDDEEAIRAALPQIRAREHDLEDAFAAIDALYTFTRSMTETVMTLESRAVAIEDFFSSVRMKGMLKMVPLSFFTKKANSPDPVLPEWRPIEVPKSGQTVELIKKSTLLQQRTHPQQQQQQQQPEKK